nr:hypothetical protein [Tanacetum cinerariifolium]
SVIATSESTVRLFALEALAGCLPFAEVDSLVPAAVGGVIVVLELLLFLHCTQTTSLGDISLLQASFVASLSCSASFIATSERTVRLFALEDLAGCLPFAEVDSLMHVAAVRRGVTVVLFSRLLFVASLICSASVIATSESTVRLFALEALAGCLPFAEVDSLVPAAVGGVIVVLELLLVFLTLALVFGGAAPNATA